MQAQEFHPSDQELLLAMDGELSAREYARVQAHLAGCWDCRTRQQELETTISEFMRMHRRGFDMQIPPIDGPRALLKARLAQFAQTERKSWLHRFRGISWRLSWRILGVACGLGMIAYLAFQYGTVPRPEHSLIVTTPDPSLTPGATILVTRGQVCRGANTKNKAVPVALQRRVFAEYGIGSAEPSMYEVDYLITPALGGADDIHNLWPQSNAATLWNSQVKDVLEDYLREQVCTGQLDLATAQRDIATNWIEAYKKYFHTDRPLSQVP
jgi:hypothetical protein